MAYMEATLKKGTTRKPGTLDRLTGGYGVGGSREAPPNALSPMKYLCRKRSQKL